MILDALLVAGLILNGFKASDLLLRRSRHAGLPQVLHRLVQQLETQRPLEHLRRLASERGQRRLLLMGIAEFLLVVAADITVEMWTGESTMTIGSFGVVVCTIALALSLASVPFVNRLGGLALTRWLVQDTRVPAFLRRFVLVFTAGVAVLGTYQAALWGTAYLAGAGDPFDVLESPLDGAGARAWMIATALVAASPPFVYFWMLLQTGVAALSTWALARVGAGLLSVVRVVAEGLMRYDRGAWAAVALAATVALGVVKVMVLRAG